MDGVKDRERACSGSFQAGERLSKPLRAVFGWPPRIFEATNCEYPSRSVKACVCRQLVMTVEHNAYQESFMNSPTTSFCSTQHMASAAARAPDEMAASH